ncbi:MAG: PIN domain-containing protein [Acidobacteria bacterium]|nr:MAG: PIN domain-containing protein [Acidobacteriota bacterium]
MAATPLPLRKPERHFDLIRLRCPELVEPDVDTAFRLALQRQISLWDAIYLALALERRCDLITADRRLYRTLAPHYPFVKMLGSGL